MPRARPGQGRRRRPRPAPGAWRADLEARLEGLDAPVVAIEGVWDGDTTGRSVQLLAIVVRGGRHEAVHLGAYRGADGDLRLFDGTVPPWPEAVAAAIDGAALASARSVPFHFASPDEPDDLAPRWSTDPR